MKIASKRVLELSHFEMSDVILSLLFQGPRESAGPPYLGTSTSGAGMGVLGVFSVPLGS